MMAGSAQGRTWYVEKDGSGDFIEIQFAVWAADDGDTIVIGPGRFDFYQIIWMGDDPVWDVYVYIVDKGLTLISPASTTIPLSDN